MPHHSIIRPGPDKEAHEALRLEWARGAMTAKDVEVATGLSDEEVSQHITTTVMKEASEKEIATALQREKDSEEKEQKALGALKHKENQMTAMERNFKKAHNDIKHEQARSERAIEELKVRDNTISSMTDDVKKMKKKYEVLERKYVALEEAEKKQRELVKQQEGEI
ncbi:hypothetical protein Dimus_003098 [Dionaea muscipula]